MTARAILVRADGALSSDPAPATAQALLAALVDEDDDSDGGGNGARNAAAAHRPAASYTTALAEWVPDTGEYVALDWHLHAERLVRNLRLLSEGESDDDGKALAALATERAAAALRALAASSNASPPRAAMLVVALPPSSPRQPVAYAKAAPAYAEAWLAGVGAGAAPPPSLRAVAALGSGGRQRATAKHCRWVLERRALEAWSASLPGGPFDEVLLVEEDDQVLEGLASNMVVIAEVRRREDSGEGGVRGGGDDDDGGNGGPAPNSSSTPPLTSLVLQTAGYSDNTALQGTVQRRVLEAAARLGLAVDARGPPTLAAARRGEWREALLANGLRGLVPLSSVVVKRYRGGGAEEGEQDDEFEVRLGPQPSSSSSSSPSSSSLAARLVAEVVRLQRRERLLGGG